MKAKVVMVSPASARDPSNGQEHCIAPQLKGTRLMPEMPNGPQPYLAKPLWIK
jgi:hypothetical protein